MDAAWVGVFGTLLGTVVGALGAFLIARWQAHRDDRFRYALDKRQLYARFISEATDYRHDLGLTRLRGRAMREEGIKMGDPKYYDPYPVADLSRVKAIFGEVSWLAPADVVSAARNLAEALTILGDRCCRTIRCRATNNGRSTPSWWTRPSAPSTPPSSRTWPFRGSAFPPSWPMLDPITFISFLTDARQTFRGRRAQGPGRPARWLGDIKPGAGPRVSPGLLRLRRSVAIPMHGTFALVASAE